MPRRAAAFGVWREMAPAGCSDTGGHGPSVSRRVDARHTHARRSEDDGAGVAEWAAARRRGRDRRRPDRPGAYARPGVAVTVPARPRRAARAWRGLSRPAQAA